MTSSEELVVISHMAVDFSFSEQPNIIKKTIFQLFLPAEEEATTEQVGEQTRAIVHLGEDHLMARRTGKLNWTVSQRTSCHYKK